MKKNKYFLGLFCTMLMLASCGMGVISNEISSFDSAIISTANTNVISSENSVCAGQNCTGNLQYGDKGTVPELTQSGNYESKVDVAAYIRQFHRLPMNYITESQRDSGNYNNTSYNVGGMRFGNYEGYLPIVAGYIECDISSTLSSRGAYRIVYNTTNWKIFYTNDHYDNFQEYLGYNNWGSSFGKNNGAYVAACNPCNSYIM